jgi:hypothetical protein
MMAPFTIVCAAQHMALTPPSWLAWVEICKLQISTHQVVMAAPPPVLLAGAAPRQATSPVPATPAAALGRGVGGSAVATPSTPSPGVGLQRGGPRQATTPNTGSSAGAGGTPVTDTGEGRPGSTATLCNKLQTSSYEFPVLDMWNL